MADQIDIVREVKALYRIRNNVADAIPTRVGAVIVFKRGTSQAEANKVLELMGAKLIERAEAHTFNPDHGGPVWYIP